MVFVRVHLMKGRLNAAQKEELGAKLVQAVSEVENLVNNHTHKDTIPHDQWAQDGRVPDWEGFRALLRADSPEEADEALALIYGPGRHTAAVWDA